MGIEKIQACRLVHSAEEVFLGKKCDDVQCIANKNILKIQPTVRGLKLGKILYSQRCDICCFIIFNYSPTHTIFQNLHLNDFTLLYF